MLYEMIVGRVPFNADTPYAIVHDHIYKPLPLPRKINPTISEAVEVVLLKALAKDREDRYPDVAALVKAFETALLSPAAAPVGVVAPAAATSVAADKAVVPEPHAAVTPPAKPVKPAKGKGKSCWVVGAWVGLVLLILIAILGVIRAGRTWISSNAGEVIWTPVAGTMAAFTPPANLEEIPGMAMVEDALASFQDKDMEDFWDTVQMIEELVGNKGEFYRNAGDKMIEKQAYLPAAVYYLQVFRFEPSVFKPDQSIQVREIIFREAKNPDMSGLFSTHQDDPLYQIVLSRFEVFNKTDLAGAKTRIGGMLNDPKITRDYPEVYLVMAEIYQKLNDGASARRTLITLLNKQNIPDWVMQEAQALLKTIQN